MNKDNFMKLCVDYKRLILEVVNQQFMTPAQFSKSLWAKNYKEVKYDLKVEDEKAVHLERIKSIEEDFRDTVNKLQNSGQQFCGYDLYGGHLVKIDYDVMNWTASIKQAKGLKHGLDITNAILQEMERQEQAAGLTVVSWAESVMFEGKTFVLDKEEYSTREICTMMGVAPSTFSGYKNIPNFPEPIDGPDKIPHKYTLEAVVEMFPLVEAHRANSNKKIPSNRRKRKKTTKKHRRT